MSSTIRVIPGRSWRQAVDDSRGRTRSALPRRPAHTDYQRDSYGVGEDRDDTA